MSNVYLEHPSHKLLKWFLLVLFIGYYGSISLFTHVHIERGTTIVHAHPFKKTADGSTCHHKSPTEIQLFHYLTSIHVADGAVHPLLFHFFAVPFYVLSESPVYPSYLKPDLGGLSLRAPPALS